MKCPICNEKTSDRKINNKHIKNWIVEEYITKNITIKQLAKNLNVSPSTVLRLLDNYGIKKRK